MTYFESKFVRFEFFFLQSYKILFSFVNKHTI
jgi:hypothetical protein